VRFREGISSLRRRHGRGENVQGGETLMFTETGKREAVIGVLSRRKTVAETLGHRRCPVRDRGDLADA